MHGRMTKGTGAGGRAAPRAGPSTAQHKLNHDSICWFPPCISKIASIYTRAKERIEEALTYQHSNPEVSISQIARDFKVPYTRLYARFKGRVSRYQRLQVNTVLTEAQENAPCSYID